MVHDGTIKFARFKLRGLAVGLCILFKFTSQELLPFSGGAGNKTSKTAAEATLVSWFFPSPRYVTKICRASMLWPKPRNHSRACENCGCVCGLALRAETYVPAKGRFA